jgi:hypothetical protein
MVLFILLLQQRDRGTICVGFEWVSNVMIKTLVVTVLLMYVRRQQNNDDKYRSNPRHLHSIPHRSAIRYLSEQRGGELLRLGAVPPVRTH